MSCNVLIVCAGIVMGLGRDARLRKKRRACVLRASREVGAGYLDCCCYCYANGVVKPAGGWGWTPGGNSSKRGAAKPGVSGYEG